MGRNKSTCNKLNYREIGEWIIRSLLGEEIDFPRPYRSGDTFLSECIRNGYSVMNVWRLLQSDDVNVINEGFAALSEVGTQAKPFVDEVAELLFLNAELWIRPCLDIFIGCADRSNMLANWILVACINHDDIDIARRAMQHMLRIDDNQLRGAKDYLINHRRNSPHLLAIDFYLSCKTDINEILKALDSSCLTKKKYAVIMAVPFFEINAYVLDKAMQIEDKTICYFLNRYVRSKRKLQVLLSNSLKRNHLKHEQK